MYISRMPSNLGIERAPLLVLGNFIRKRRLQKSKKGPLRGLDATPDMTCYYVRASSN